MEEVIKTLILFKVLIKEIMEDIKLKQDDKQYNELKNNSRKILFKDKLIQIYRIQNLIKIILILINLIRFIKNIKLMT